MDNKMGACVGALFCFLVSYSIALSHTGQSIAPQFDWYETYLSEDDSLIIEEVSRIKGKKGTIITYKIKAKGFTVDKPVTLWKKNGGNFQKHEYDLKIPVEMSSDVLVEINFEIENFKKGQALDIALVAEDTSKISHTKFYPFPLRERGTGGCSVTAELCSEAGHLFLMVFSGFDPGEKVRIMNRLGRCIETSVTEASDDGMVYYCAGFSERARGKAMISAFTCDRKVSMEYGIGEDILLPQ